MKVTIDRLAGLEKALKTLANTRVMVGVPADETARRDGAITNAALAYIHEHGAPEVGIPARSFLKPGIKAAQSAVEGLLVKAAQSALAGQDGATRKALEAAGLTAVTSIRDVISAGIPPPLKPATVARRRTRSKGSKYRRQAMTAAMVTPLIDTGQLRNSITYVLRKVA